MKEEKGFKTSFAMIHKPVTLSLNLATIHGVIS